MTRTSSIALWGSIGAALIIGLGISTISWLGSLEVLAGPAVRDLGAFVDVLAVLFWMLVLAVSATYGSGSGPGH